MISIGIGSRGTFSTESVFCGHELSTALRLFPDLHRLVLEPLRLNTRNLYSNRNVNVSDLLKPFDLELLIVYKIKLTSSTEFLLVFCRCI